MMRKLHLLLIISLISLSMMACGMIGFAQIESEPQTLENSDGVKTETLEGLNLADEVDSSPQEQQPTPAPTLDPIVEAKSCLAKTWEIAGLSDYVIAAIPPEMAAEYDLQYEETTGSAFFELSPDGQIVLKANDLQLFFSAQAYVFKVPVTVSLDGTATGNYTVDGTTLTINDVDTGKLNASAQALGEDLIDPDQIMNSIPFLHPPHNIARYTCEGDVLVLTLSGYGNEVPPLVFQAVEE